MPILEPQTGSTLEFGRDVYSVARLNREVRTVLEGSFPLLWVEGEISNLARPSSGHLYFSLKDEYAQVRCALFRMRRNRLRFQPREGQQVLVRVRVSLYEGRGDFQLLVEHMEPAGEGALREAVERLKRRLAAEGLFAASRKRELPVYPRRIGVITSPSGAAVRDVLSVLRRRFPALPAIVYAAPVQGEGAAQQLLAMLRTANVRAECDLLILTRGGGSLEDLMAFNDEALARGIAASAIPVVAGVGHEIDFTIADLVADRRAATPSAAAELASPDRAALQPRVAALLERMKGAVRRRLREEVQRCEGLAGRLRRAHPGQVLRQRQQRLDLLEQRLGQLLRRRLDLANARLRELASRLVLRSPAHRVERLRLAVRLLEERLQRATAGRLEAARQRLVRAAGGLDLVSPLATLQRGYAIVTRVPDGRVLRDARDAPPGQQVQARLASGSLLCRVEGTQGLPGS